MQLFFHLFFRSLKQSDQFPMIPNEGIIQFNEFTNEEDTEKH